MVAHEAWGQWRLFTSSDLGETLEGWKPAETRSLDTPETKPSGDHGQIRASDKAVGGALRALERHVRALGFEHGREGKIPRANTFRPYRLTVNGALVAVIALRASEAFNVCEVDVFLTTEIPGLKSLETTRAALLFAMSDAVKSGGSMAIQFTRPCGPSGVPKHVRAVAAQAGVPLRHADKGTLSPEEVRELFLRLCGLPADAQQRVRDLAARRFFTIERVCQLMAAGIWPAGEASYVLLCGSCPELVLGAGANPTQRLLAAHALVVAKAAILGGVFGRALRYVRPPVRESSIVERGEYLEIPQQTDPPHLAICLGPLPTAVPLEGWAPRGDTPLELPARTTIAALPRPRSREEIRTFVLQDLHRAQEIARSRDQTVVLVYPADYRGLGDNERLEIQQAAARRGVTILASPASVADLEAECWRRQRIGRTIRS